MYHQHYGQNERTEGTSPHDASTHGEPTNFQCDSEYCRISITCNIVRKTKSCKVITHLKWSLIADDICLITVLLICRTNTAYLTTRKKELTRNICSCETICYIALIYPCRTILIRYTIYTYLIVYIIESKYGTWLFIHPESLIPNRQLSCIHQLLHLSMKN